VAVATNLIDSILDSSSLSSDMSMVLANAIHFNNKWDKLFTDLHTMVAKLYLLRGGTTKARFIRSRKSQFIIVHDGCKVLKLPYKSRVPRSSQRRMGDQRREKNRNQLSRHKRK
jgi:serpin B